MENEIEFRKKKIITTLNDNEYPQGEITHTRIIARGVILNDKNEVLLLHILGDDIFGHRDYYETPGGGVNTNETLEEGLLREIKEETGIEASIIDYIGFVDDYYNLIKRHNNNFYFLLKANRFGKPHPEDYEKCIIENMKWHNIDKAIELYSNMNKTKIERLVSNRELPIIIEAKRMLESTKKSV